VLTTWVYRREQAVTSKRTRQKHKNITRIWEASGKWINLWNFPLSPENGWFDSRIIWRLNQIKTRSKILSQQWGWWFDHDRDHNVMTYTSQAVVWMCYRMTCNVMWLWEMTCSVIKCDCNSDVECNAKCLTV
jgi:hypothetical protein